MEINDNIGVMLHLVIWSIVTCTITVLGDKHKHTKSTETGLIKTMDAKSPLEYCQAEYFNVSCAANHVILMSNAQYGRMRKGRCVSGSYGQVGCAVDVLPYFDRKCSGRQTCTVYVSDPVLHSMRPCPKDLASYLEAEYSCQKVVVGSFHQCHVNHKVPASGASGFLASAAAVQHGYGTSRCPWEIQARPRQTVKLSLLHFMKGRFSHPGLEQPRSPDVCYEIGLIKDGDNSKIISLCGDNGREKIIYESHTHKVKVQLLSSEVLKGLPPFLIHYEVVGCDQLQPPEGGMVTFMGNMATIKCNQSQETWYVTCSGTSWMGEVGNCTQGAVDQGPFVSLREEGEFPVGILAVVALGVALGVFFGGALLSLVAIYMKRRRHNYARPSTLCSMEDKKEGANYASHDLSVNTMNTVLTSESSKLYSEGQPPGQQPCMYTEQCPTTSPQHTHDLIGVVYTDHVVKPDGTHDSKLYALGCARQVQCRTADTATLYRSGCRGGGGMPPHHYELTHTNYDPAHHAN